MTITQPLTVAIAGTTIHTLQIAQAIVKDDKFNINLVLTPTPKKVGRQQELKLNPVHSWAKKHQINTLLVDKKIGDDIQQKINQVGQKNDPPDFLLVVDFGYIIPKWLLNWPNLSAVNLHPSLLPRWRGSSPGQFVILNHEQQSAITLMELATKLDSGDIITQLLFPVANDWTSQDYYQFSFNLASQHIATWLWQYAQGQLTPQTQPQTSPTRIARRLKKQDAFLPWSIITAATHSHQQQTINTTQLDWPQQSITRDYVLAKNQEEWPQLIQQASLAFQPWPILWTEIPTKKGKKRMQVLACHTQEEPQPHLVLDQVKIAGQKQAHWNQVKNQVKNTVVET